MITSIGAMHAALRAKKKAPEDKINFRKEVKKRRRLRIEDDGDEDGEVWPRRRERERNRGVTI